MTEGNANEVMVRPVVDALSAIAQVAGRNVLANDQHENWCGKSDYDVAIFSYARDFEDLWGLKDGMGGLNGIVNGLAASRQNQDELTILIVWDGMPDSDGDTVAVGRYVTPYDWAIALSVELYRQGREKSHVHPQLRVLILDIASHHIDTSFIQRSFFAFHNLFPWIQGYRPVATGSAVLVEAAVDDSDCEAFAQLRQAIPPDRCDAGRLVRDLLQPGCVMTTFPDDAGRVDDLEAVVESWRQQFLRAGDRHSVANLIAPFVLAAGLPRDVRDSAQDLIEKNSLPRRALREVLELIGLLRVEEATGGGSPVGMLSRDGGVFGRCSGVRFLLIDDQYRLGYHHILAYTLFGSRYDPDSAKNKGAQWNFEVKHYASLSCMEHAGQLLAGLKASEPIEDWSLPRLLSVPDADVLLLDLRLWTKGQNEVCRQFMEEVVAACRHLGTGGLDDPAFQRAFQAAEQLVRGEEANEIPALTLLVLLISHFDPSLPIVLFSSTHQRDVIELVSHRTNIVTIFSKPVLSGYGEDLVPTRIIEDLRQALQRAVDLHEERVVWKRIIDADWGGLPVFSVNTTWGKNEPNKTIYNVPDAPRQEPRFMGDRLRKILSSWYVRYLQSGYYYDFASVPYELVEGDLTPLFVTQRFFKTGFNLVDDDSDAGRRNRTVRALQNIRNRKAHGHVNPPSTCVEARAWRCATILEFMLFLDYIESACYTKDGLESEVRRGVNDYWKRIRTVYGEQLGALADSFRVPQEAYRLTSAGGLPWLIFVVYAVSHALGKSVVKNTVYISEQTYSSLMRLMADSLVKMTMIPARKQSHERAMKREAKVPGEQAGRQSVTAEIERLHVTSHASTGFYVGSQPDEHQGFCDSVDDNKPPVGAVVEVRFDYSRFSPDGYFYVQLLKDKVDQ